MTAKVFICKEIETQKEVAIKFLKDEHLAKSSDREADFDREIEILKGLDHNGIVRMHEAGQDGYVITTKH